VDQLVPVASQTPLVVDLRTVTHDIRPHCILLRLVYVIGASRSHYHTHGIAVGWSLDPVPVVRWVLRSPDATEVGASHLVELDRRPVALRRDSARNLPADERQWVDVVCVGSLVFIYIFDRQFMIKTFLLAVAMD